MHAHGWKMELHEITIHLSIEIFKAIREPSSIKSSAETDPSVGKPDAKLKLTSMRRTADSAAA